MLNVVSAGQVHLFYLARLLPHATLVELPGAGHEQPPPQLWDLTVAALLEHTAG